mgnify:CR=1 FL=1
MPADLARARRDRSARRSRTALGVGLAGSLVAPALFVGAPAAGPIVGAGLVARAIASVPQPDPLPRRWEFDVEPGSLRVASVDVPGEGPSAFYYMTYKVTNNTGEDRFLAPLFELATDDGDIVRSGLGVPRVVSEELLARQRNELLLDEISAQGMLLQGRENAREALVVWRADDLDVDEVVVYAAGFSGETETIRRPDTGEEVVLRKTLMLRHAVPGELNPRSRRPLERTMERWILR